MEKKIDEHLNKYGGKLYGAMTNNPISKSMALYNKMIGNKRPRFFALFGSSGDNLPDYPESNIDDAGDLFDPNKGTGEVTISSFYENEWTVLVSDMTQNTFANNLTEKEGDHFWIGTLESTSLSNGLHKLQNSEFNLLNKSGVYFNEDEKDIYVLNTKNRAFTYTFNQSMYMKMTNLQNSYCLSIGKNLFNTHHIRLENSQDKFFVAVKYSTITLSKILGSVVEYSSWNDGVNIFVDSIDYDILFCSNPISSNIETNVDIYTPFKSIFLHNSSLYNTFFNFFEKPSTIQKNYLVGIENGTELFLNTNSTYLKIKDIDVGSEYNGDRYLRFLPQDVNGLRRVSIGASTRYYDTVVLDNTTPSPSTMRYGVLIKNANSSISKYSGPLDTNVWLGTGSVSAVGGLQGSDIYDFLTNEEDSRKAIFEAATPASTYYFPSDPLPINTTITKAYEFVIDPNNPAIFMGLMNQYREGMLNVNYFEPSDLAVINLATGAIEIEGQPFDVDFGELPATVVFSITKLFDGRVMISIGTNETDTNQSVILQNHTFNDVSVYITGQNLNQYTNMIALKNIVPKGIVGQTSDIPTEVTYPLTDITNMGDPFDENSSSGTFVLTSNDVNTWSVLTFDYSGNVLASSLTANVLGEGHEMYIGVAHDNILQNGLSSFSSSSFAQIQKSGVNFVLTPTFTQKIYKYNSFSRDLDIVLYPTLYVKVSELNSSHCLSIGVNNYKTRNIKLTVPPTKIFFAVRKGTINFNKLAASSVVKTQWTVGDEISIDASEVDVYLKSEEYNTDKTNFISVTSSTNTSAVWDYFVKDSSGLTKNVNFSDSNFVKDFLVGVEDRVTCSFLENSQYVTYNTINPLKWRSKIFFNYFDGNDRRQFDLGEDEGLYFSAFLSNESPLYSNYVNIVHFKDTIVELVVEDTSPWKDTTILNFYNGGTIGSQIYDFATSSNFPEKVGLNTSLPGQTQGTYFFPSTYIGPGAPSRTVDYIFEYAVEDDVYMGIYDEANPDVVKTSTFFSNDLFKVNLKTGAIIYENISSSFINTSTPGTVYLKLTSLDNGKTLMNIGTNEGDIQTAYQYNGNIHNPRFYITSNNLTDDRMITLKKIAGPAMNGGNNEIPVDIVYPPSDDSTFGDIFLENSTFGNFRVSSNSDTDWTTFVCPRTHDKNSTSNIVMEGREVFIGVIFSGNPNGFETANQVQFDAITKSGVMLRFESPFNKNVIKNNVVERNITFSMTTSLYIRISFLGSEYCLSIGKDNYNCSHIKLSAEPQKMFFAVRKGTLSFTKVHQAVGMQTGMSVGTEFEIDGYDYDVRLNTTSILNSSQFENLLTITSNTGNVKPDITFGSALNYASNISLYPSNSSISTPPYLVKQELMTSTYVYDNNSGQNILTGTSTDTDGNKIFLRYDSNHPDTTTRAVYIGTDSTKYTSSYLDSNVLSFTAYLFTIIVKQTVLKFSLTSNTVSNWTGNVNETFLGISGTFSSTLSDGNYQKNRYSLQGSDTNGTLYFPSVSIDSTNQLRRFVFEFERLTTGTVTIGILNQSNPIATYSNVTETSTDWKINLTTGMATVGNNDFPFTFGNDVTKPKIIIMSFKYTVQGILINFGTNGQNANQGKVFIGLTNIRLYISGSGVTSQAMLVMHRVSLNGLTGTVDEIPTTAIISSDVDDTANLNVPEDETSYFSLVSPTANVNQWKVLVLPMPTNSFYGEITWTGNWIYICDKTTENFTGFYTSTYTGGNQPMLYPGTNYDGGANNRSGIIRWSGEWKVLNNTNPQTPIPLSNRLYMKFDYSSGYVTVGESIKKTFAIKVYSPGTRLMIAVRDNSTFSFQKIRNSLVETMENCQEGDVYFYPSSILNASLNIRSLFLTTLDLTKQYTIRLRVQNFANNNFQICIPSNGFQLTSPIKYSNFSGSDVILAGKTQVTGSSGSVITAPMPTIPTLDTDFYLSIHFAYVVVSGFTYIIFGFGEENNYVTVVKNYALPTNSQLLIVGDTTNVSLGSLYGIITVVNVHKTDLPNYQSVLGGTYVNFNREDWISGSSLIASYNYIGNTYRRWKVPFNGVRSFTSFGTSTLNKTYKFEFFTNPEINVYFAVINTGTNETFQNGTYVTLPVFVARMNLSTGETEDTFGAKTQNGSTPHNKLWVSVTVGSSSTVRIGSDRDIVPLATTQYNTGNMTRFKFVVYTDAITTTKDYLLVFHEIYSYS